MKRLVVILALILVMGIVGCESSDTPKIDDSEKSMSEMTDVELIQMADRNQQLAQSSRRLPGISSYAALANVYQNERIIRLLSD